MPRGAKRCELIKDLVKLFVYETGKTEFTVFEFQEWLKQKTLPVRYCKVKGYTISSLSGALSRVCGITRKEYISGYYINVYDGTKVKR